MRFVRQFNKNGFKLRGLYVPTGFLSEPGFSEFSDFQD
jgi:hypothetical protein